MTIKVPEHKVWSRREVSDRQYIARLRRTRHPADCEHGHFDCAVWENGPCMDEVLSRIEAEGCHCSRGGNAQFCECREGA